MRSPPPGHVDPGAASGDHLADMVPEAEILELAVHPSLRRGDAAAHATADDLARHVRPASEACGVGVVAGPGDRVEVGEQLTQLTVAAADACRRERGIHLPAVVALEHDELLGPATGRALPRPFHDPSLAAVDVRV